MTPQCIFYWFLPYLSYVLSRGTSRTLHPPWKIFDHKSTAGRLEKQKYVWPTGQTPTEGLSTPQTNFWQFRRTFREKKVRLVVGRPRKNLKFYSIFECIIKWHYILNEAYCTWWFFASKGSKYARKVTSLSSETPKLDTFCLFNR